MQLFYLCLDSIAKMIVFVLSFKMFIQELILVWIVID